MTRMNRASRSVQCGEVWQASLDPVVGHEQGGTRPVLVVSGEHFNLLPHGRCVVAPVTSRVRDIPTHVPLHPSEGGLKLPSVAMCDRLRTISLDRLEFRRGTVEASTIDSVKSVIQLVFDL